MDKSSFLKTGVNQGESLNGTLARLETSEEGLSTVEAARRLDLLGSNDFKVSRFSSMFSELFRAAANPLNFILLFASGASAFLGELTDALIIFFIVLLSTALNFWQTFRSEVAVRRLQSRITPLAKALRDGDWVDLPRSSLVPGDRIQLAAGDLVPADARLIDERDLHVQQAALTGESFPVEKEVCKDGLAVVGPESLDLVYLGTSVVSGTATAVVFSTGLETAFGDIVERLSSRPEETEFERGISQFGKLILQTTIFLVLFILIVNLGMGRNALQSLLFSVALAVGLTPEFLPMITTVTLAQGAIRMAREKVIVKHLSSMQNLGGMDVLCSDKTGTLTKGTFSVDGSLDCLGEPSERPLFYASLNSKFESGIKSPIDAAILELAVPGTDIFVKTDEVPFDFERRRLSIVAERGGERVLITKGAPESVLDVCREFEIRGESRSLDTAARERALAIFRELSKQGRRVIAVARKRVERSSGFSFKDEEGLALVGFVTFSDPLVEGVKESLARLRRDGVQLKILTGDNEWITRRICSDVGLSEGRIVQGNEIDRMDEMALAHVVDQSNVFVRVSPGQKHRILHALKSKGHVVGFLGDGINDAPALHGADVGISVASAVDVAREASDIILLERGLDVLHAGIIAGRRSFGNVLKYILMGTSSNFGNMFSMAAATLFLPFLPMLPTQILLNNVLYDFAQVTIPTDNVDSFYLERPRRWDNRTIRNFMLLIGPVSSLFDFLTFYILLRIFRFGEVLFHTGWFLESLATQVLVLFVIRTVGRPWKQLPSVALAVTAVSVLLIGTLIPFSPVGRLMGFAPMPLEFFLLLIFIVVIYLSIVEFAKRRVFRAYVNGP